jgi:hypothetical protein
LRHVVNAAPHLEMQPRALAHSEPFYALLSPVNDQTVARLLGQPLRQQQPRRTSTFIVSSVVAAAARRRSACGIAHILKVPGHRLVQRSREIT